jgi:hypothetical protein
MREYDYAVKAEPLRLAKIQGAEVVTIRFYIQPQNLRSVVANIRVDFRVPHQENPIVPGSVVTARVRAWLVWKQAVSQIGNFLSAAVGIVLIS